MFQASVTPNTPNIASTAAQNSMVSKGMAISSPLGEKIALMPGADRR